MSNLALVRKKTNQQVGHGFQGMRVCGDLINPYAMVGGCVGTEDVALKASAVRWS